MKTWRAINWKSIGLLALTFAIMTASAFAEEAAPKSGSSSSFFETAAKAGVMELVLLIVSIAGVALCLQALVTLRAHLLRPPELAAELNNLVQEGNLDGAFDAAQGDASFLGAVAFATLSNAQYGKEAMEGALADTGEVEANKLMTKVNTLNLIAAIAPMLGLTGTTLGMMKTFQAMSAGSNVTPDKMAEGISVALVCTFTGLCVAIPLLTVAYFLKSRVTQIVFEVSNDCNELIRAATSGEQPAEG